MMENIWTEEEMNGYAEQYEKEEKEYYNFLIEQYEENGEGNREY